MNDRTAMVDAATAPTEELSEERASFESQPVLSAIREGCVLVDGRIRVSHRIGSGGMGSVYHAFDELRHGSVALKTLNLMSPSGIYQFKNEFRALCDVRHPNLVGLHELFVDHELWFFTMDLIEGETFDRWTRPDDRLDESRLRAVLPQLLDALEAIHAAGKLHRDIKPSNVLVTRGGRLVVLDFGLAIDPQEGSVGQTLPELAILGTPAYMAPEQAGCRPSTTATDFYAMGAMLYEALTGERPFMGTQGEILAAKQLEAPPRPDSRELPADLVELCMGLIERDPAGRPDATVIRAALGRSALQRSLPRTPEPLSEPHALVGRARELQQLRDAYATARAGCPVLVSLAGESGIGKTALVQAFLEEVARADEAVVLTGRCFEHENVPFKVLDPVVDSLSRYLRRLPLERAAALLPRDAFALGQLFPVLLRVPAFADAPWRNVPDPRELQRLAFAAFGELLFRIRARQPLVVFVDDVQWSDADSAKFVRTLVVDPDPAAALYISSHRCEALQPNAPLAVMLEAAAISGMFDVREIRLGPLSPEHAAELAARVLDGDGRAASISRAIATESQGNAFYAMELARFAQANRALTDAPSLDEVIASRVAVLPEQCRRLLAILALAGQPLRVEVLLRAGYGYEHLAALRDGQLSRSPDGRANKLAECFHDRVRDSVLRSLSVRERAARYAELARALGADADSELLSRCCEGTCDLEKASRHAAIAAKKASASLAFDRAAELYRRALALGHEHRLARLQDLGQALENSGRCLEAATAYLEAAAHAETQTALDLKRRAAEQLMLGGEFERGMELLHAVASAIELRIPTGVGAALTSMAWSLAKLRLIPVGRLREDADASSIESLASLRLRTLRSAVTGLSGYLPLQTGAAAAAYLLEAYAHGDARERAQAASFHAHTQCMIDPNSPRAHALLSELDANAASSARPEWVGFSQLVHGTIAFGREDGQKGRLHFASARDAFRQSTGVEWELDATNVYDQLCAYSCGDYADIARATPALLDEAMRRGRVWALAMLSGFAGMPAWLVSGDVEGYRARAHEARSRWRSRAMPAWPDYMLLVADALLEVYVGRPERGADQLELRFAEYRRSFIARRTHAGVVGYANHRGTCAAAALAKSSTRAARARHLATLREVTHTLRKRGGAKSRAVAALYDAAVEFNARVPERGIAQLRAAITALEAAGVNMRLAAARCTLGGIVCGQEGAALRASGESFMRAQGVIELERMIELNCPGFVSAS